MCVKCSNNCGAEIVRQLPNNDVTVEVPTDKYVGNIIVGQAKDRASFVEGCNRVWGVIIPNFYRGVFRARCNECIV